MILNKAMTCSKHLSTWTILSGWPLVLLSLFTMVVSFPTFGEVSSDKSTSTDPETIVASAVIRSPLFAETRTEARIQGTVFANTNEWTCIHRQCWSYVVGRDFIAEMCSAIASEVGPLNAFIAGDLRLSTSELNKCNHLEQDQTSHSPTLKTSRFSLVQKDDDIFLESSDQEKFEVSSDWIISPEEISKEHVNNISTTDFDKQVQEFPIGNGLIGLHISTYAISKEGSMQLAMGRDAFLVFDMKQNKVIDGGIHLGISKSRNRGAGYWTAKAHRYYLQDVNNDSRVDIAVVKEVFDCVGLRPSIRTSSVKWYTFHYPGWAHDTAFDGRPPTSSHNSELPLIGIGKSPVQFVVDGCIKSSHLR